MTEPAIRVSGLRKAYPRVSGRGRAELELFRGLTFSVMPGELVAIVGQSGAGKSSLLHLLAALDSPSEGEVWVGGHAVTSFREASASAFRNRQIGYVWQFHYLMPEFTAEENVAMPLLARGEKRTLALEKARRWLAEVGLAERREHRSGELSGGEQQRVSLARALATEPRVLLADEPTGDLDGHTAEAVFSLIQTLHRKHALTSVLVTHSLEFAARCDRVLTLKDGVLREGTKDEGVGPRV
jgi:lipoprotein-releasing system ATP-binding protein